MKVRPIVAWFDLWVGVFIDRPRRRVYILPVPCVGIVVSWEAVTRERAAVDTAGIEVAFPLPGEPTMDLLETCDGPGGPPVRRWNVGRGAGPGDTDA